MYRELVEKAVNNRGRIVETQTIGIAPADYCRYASMFMFDKDILPHVKVKKSVMDYKGRVYADAIWIDIDHDKDLKAAMSATIEVIGKLNSDYMVDPDDLYTFFSGGKGFHIAIHTRLIGFTQNTPIEPAWVKMFVRKITEGIDCVDIKIYEPVRIFRVANSRHEKTGLYKIPISFTELDTLSLSQIQALASKPRPDFKRAKPIPTAHNEELYKEWLNASKMQKEAIILPASFTGSLFSPPQAGERNTKLFIQACRLFDESQLSSAAIADIIGCINNCCAEPLDHIELSRILHNAERKVQADNPKQPAQQEQMEVRSFGEWLPDWESFVLEKESNMSLLFQPVNEKTKGRLKGKLGVVMGYGGSKKSLYGMNVLLRNIKATGEVGVYSSMEMSVPQLMNRIIDHEVEVPFRHAHEAIIEKMRKDINEGRRHIRQSITENVGNRLQITGASRLTFAEYDRMITHVTTTVGPVCALVVDGLSMMGGKGTENEMYSKNTAELKELANKWGILVILICHVSKGGELHSRDLSRLIRGSEKILDNCDFYMTMSQIHDEDGGDVYRQDIGFVNFKDKRGTGLTVEVVYSFDAKRMLIADSPLPPEDFREPKRKSAASKLDAPF
jgi:hypothetical protein